MTRLARVVIPGCPHHVIQRGNHRERVFFDDADRLLYLRLLRIQGKKHGITYDAYCLMDNHVHFIAVPRAPSSLARGFGIAHHKYTSLINIRENLSGHLWQARFLSYPLDEPHVIAAIRYIERNPVRAGVVLNPEDYVWSSARAHALGLPDPLISPCAQLPPPGDWAAFLRAPAKEKEEEMIRDHARNERPLGCDQFIKTLEAMTGRVLSYKRRGRKKGK